jgi:hypothetical protein
MPDSRYRCSINELRNCSCRYPLWPANAAHHQRLYCGCPDASLSDDIPYCRHHTMLCETPSR